MASTRKSRLFIASSVESLPVAEAINANLDHELEVTLWKTGTFRLSSSTIDDLVRKSSAVDFAAFVFTPDDISVIRSQKEHVVRDNVLFELGLFIGAIGKERCFIIKPRDTDLHIPTDLIGGMAPADYESNRSDGDIMSETNRACTLIKTEVARLGQLAHISNTAKQRLVVNPESYALTTSDLLILSWALRSYTDYPGGNRISELERTYRKMPDPARRLGVVKLERLGHIERTIEQDREDGYNYYSYKITDSGIAVLLNHHAKVQAIREADFKEELSSDDIPF